MTQYEFRIQLPLPGGGMYDLCPCWTPEGAAAVVRSLLEYTSPPPVEIRIVVAPRMEDRR